MTAELVAWRGHTYITLARLIVERRRLLRVGKERASKSHLRFVCADLRRLDVRAIRAEEA